MRASKVLRKLRNGEVARICNTGSFLPFYPKMAAHCGFDAIWVDGEHRVFNPHDAQSFLAYHHLADIDCIWRPPTVQKGMLYRLLEDGATGLMIPHVSTPEMARQLVNAVKFPPLGERGLDGSGIDGNFYINLPASYPQDANRETFLVVQIETPLALENVDAIAAVEGVDALFLGPGDMSLRLACSAAVSDPTMMAAQKKIAGAAKKHGKAWGRPVGSISDAKVIVELGGQLIAYGGTHMAIFRFLQANQAEFDAWLGKQN